MVRGSSDLGIEHQSKSISVENQIEETKLENLEFKNLPVLKANRGVVIYLLFKHVSIFFMSIVL